VDKRLPTCFSTANNQCFCPQQDGLINFNKHRKEFEILAQLMLYQKAAANYSFPSHPPLERWLKDHLLLSEQERWVGGRGS